MRKVIVKFIVCIILWIAFGIGVYIEDNQIMQEPSKIVTAILLVACLQTIFALVGYTNLYKERNRKKKSKNEVR